MRRPWRRIRTRRRSRVGIIRRGRIRRLIRDGVLRPVRVVCHVGSHDGRFGDLRTAARISKPALEGVAALPRRRQYANRLAVRDLSACDLNASAVRVERHSPKRLQRLVYYRLDSLFDTSTVIGEAAVRPVAIEPGRIKCAVGRHAVAHAVRVRIHIAVVDDKLAPEGVAQTVEVVFHDPCPWTPIRTAQHKKELPLRKGGIPGRPRRRVDARGKFERPVRIVGDVRFRNQAFGDLIAAFRSRPPADECKSIFRHRRKINDVPAPIRHNDAALSAVCIKANADRFIGRQHPQPMPVAVPVQDGLPNPFELGRIRPRYFTATIVLFVTTLLHHRRSPEETNLFQPQKCAAGEEQIAAKSLHAGGHRYACQTSAALKRERAD